MSSRENRSTSSVRSSRTTGGRQARGACARAFRRAERLPPHRHAKSICLNFASPRSSRPVQPALRRHESHEGGAGVRRRDRDDVRWLGFSWDDREFYASDYFEQLYEYAVHLVKAGKAYVDSLTRRGPRAPRHAHRAGARVRTATARSRRTDLPPDARGEFEDGAHVLRAKIDMASPNLYMRDRRCTGSAGDPPSNGRRVVHLPMYDYAHPLSDAIRGITHSLCTLEFETTGRSTTGSCRTAQSVRAVRSSSRA